MESYQNANGSAIYFNPFHICWRGGENDVVQLQKDSLARN